MSVAERVGRTKADLALLVVTAVELALLVRLTPTFTLTDWVYVSQHLVVLGIALTRDPPKAQDRSLASNVAVVVAYAYPYAQVVCVRWRSDTPVWPSAGLVLVTLAAFLSAVSLFSLGKSFGIRPAWRGLATTGPYRLVRHPLYLAYLIADIGYNFQGWNRGTLLVTAAGWISLVYRIHAEEQILSRDRGWRDYVAAVRYRLVPGLW